MKYIFLILLLVPTVLADVQISEVLYDPIATESGGEAVMLYNPTDLPINITNYLLKTESSAIDATLPGVILQPKEYFLVADVNWQTLKDNQTFPNANYEEAITLTNTNAGIALIKNNEIIDAVGWGDPLQIDQGLYQGTPATHVSAGNSLKRISTTNNNANDFIETYPFLTEKQQQSNQIVLTAKVCSTTNILEINTIDEDLMTQGIQILPIPKQQKIIPITTNIEGSPEQVTAALLNNNQIITSTSLTNNNNTYQGNLALNFYDQPGNYTVRVQADTKLSEIQLNYQTLTALELDTNSLGLELIPGKISDLTGDLDMKTNQTTIRNIGNTNLNLGIQATNLRSATSEISIANSTFSFDNQKLNLSNDLKLVELDFAPSNSSLKPLSLSIFAPEGTKEDTYTSTISIVGAAK